MPHVPQGVILIWSGVIGDIPAGFILCDGNGGSPDLRNLFIIGAGGTRAPHDTGGSTVHNHGFTGSGHSHTIPVGSGLQAGAGRSTVSDVDPATGTTDGASSLPPFYALAYIFKT